MASIAERLFKTEPATAPAIDFIKNLRVLDGDGSRNGGDRLQGLLGTFASILSFDLSFEFEVEVGLILVLKGRGCVLGFDNPGFRGDVFHFFEVVAASA
jgi:hypothetical protein